jgi:hypothetical protein
MYFEIISICYSNNVCKVRKEKLFLKNGLILQIFNNNVKLITFARKFQTKSLTKRQKSKYSILHTKK